MLLFFGILLVAISIWLYRYGRSDGQVASELEKMGREDFDAIFWRVVCEHLNYTESDSEVCLGQINCTPLAKIRTIEELSDDFGFEIAEEDLEREGTLQDLCDRTWSKTQRKLVFG